MTKIVWHESSHIHTRVMETQPPHDLGEWEVYHPYGTGTGVVMVAAGASAVAPQEIKAMCRVKGVWRVISSKEGYLIVTVYLERQWDRIEAELIQAYVVAKEKKDAQKRDS